MSARTQMASTRENQKSGPAVKRDQEENKMSAFAKFRII